jgi:hypothetical protein
MSDHEMGINCFFFSFSSIYLILDGVTIYYLSTVLSSP